MPSWVVAITAAGETPRVVAYLCDAETVDIPAHSLVTVNDLVLHIA